MRKTRGSFLAGHRTVSLRSLAGDKTVGPRSFAGDETVYPRSLAGDETLAGDMVATLAQFGCQDLTSSIDHANCDTFPFASGRFSDLYRGTMKNGTNIAIKSIKLHDLPGADTQAKRVEQVAITLSIWAKLKHPNVLPLLGAAVFQGCFSTITEWMENGNLVSYISRNSEKVDRVGLCLDVCRGLSYVHTLDIVHGDLKAANVLISSGGTAMIASLMRYSTADLALRFADTAASGASIRWAAPELLTADEPSHTKKTDVYACGMTMFEVLTGEVPYEDLSEIRAFIAVTAKGQIPIRPTVGESDEIWMLLRQCWERDPSKRPDISVVEERLLAISGGSPVDPGGSNQRGLGGSQSITSANYIQGQLTTVTNGARAAASRRIPGIRARARPAKFPLEPGMDFVPLQEKEGVEFLAHGSAADIWKVSNVSLPLVNESESRLPSNAVIHKIMRVGSLSRELALRGTMRHNELWRDFVKDYRSKVGRWSALKDHNVVRVMGTVDGLNLNVEFCEMGCVREYLRRKPKSYPQKADIITGILNGLCYLHSQNPPIIHGSLNAGKVFIDASGNTKVGEFGLTALCYRIAPFVPAISLASLSRWLSPEMLEDTNDEVGPTATRASDIWALGCVLFEIIAECVPYSNRMHGFQVQRSIINGEAPGRFDIHFEEEPFNALRTLLTSCWTTNPKERPSIQHAREQAVSIIKSSSSTVNFGLQ